MIKFNPDDSYAGGYSPGDGTVEFYSRIGNLIHPSSSVLNLGAGRGGWYTNDICEARRKLQDIRSFANKYIGADIDPAVLENQITTHNVLLLGERIPFDDKSFDLIVSDWVLEHVQKPSVFCAEVMRLLKPGGFFCARTPHSLAYWALSSRLIAKTSHIDLLNIVQPGRQQQDIFPAYYRLNSLKQVKKIFKGYHDYSYLYSVNPSYYFGSKFLYQLLSFVHKKILPSQFTSCLYIFVQKPMA